MSQSLQDLQNSLDALSQQAQANADASVAVLAAANNAAARVSAGIPAAVDYSAQVAQVSAVTESLALAVTNINNATTAANGILP